MHGGQHLGVRMAQRRHRGAARGVEVFAAFGVADVHAVRAGGNGRGLAKVAVEDVRHGGIGGSVAFWRLGRCGPALEPTFRLNYCLEHLFRQPPARIGPVHSFQTHAERETPAMGARDQIRQRFNELSPALQQVARYVLDHPNEVVTGSMRNVGTRSQSTPATLVRFAQHLGFDGWPRLKEAFAADMGLGG
jgi:hypothetical protein